MSGRRRIETAIKIIDSLEKELDELDLFVEDKAKELKRKAIELAKKEGRAKIRKVEERAEKIRKELEEKGKKEAAKILAEGKKRAEKLEKSLEENEKGIKDLIMKIILGEE